MTKRLAALLGEGEGPTLEFKRSTFHRTGAVEVWGRGTNRVIEACKKNGTAPPIFEERQGYVIVTFKASLVVGSATTGSRDQVGTKSGLSRDQVDVLQKCRRERTLRELMIAAGRSNRTKFRDGLVAPLIEAGFLELTIPGKPRSRMQKYRTTKAGVETLGDNRR